MTIDKLMVFKEQLEVEGIIFCYSGPVSQGLVEEIGQAIRKKMRLEEAAQRFIQKVFGIFVEQVQNIMKHSAEIQLDRAGDIESRSGIVIVGRKESTFYVVCGNLVDRDQKEHLVTCLGQVAGKDRHQLKELYKHRLRSGLPVEGQGAGLGLIDMARKASQPMEYSFSKVNGDYHFFSSKVVIKET